MKRLVWCLLLTSACATSAGGGGSGPAITGDDLGRQVAELEHAIGTFTCEDVQTVKAGAISDCRSASGIGIYRVTFDDDQGHFHVNYDAP